MSSLLISGDSFVEGVGDSPSDGGWAHRLKRDLEPNIKVHICGYGGHNIHNLADRHQKELTRYSPRLVIYEIGINDSRYRPSKGALATETDTAQFHDLYIKLVRETYRRSVQHVYLIGLSRVDEDRVRYYKPDKEHTNQSAELFDNLVVSVAKETQSTYIPINDIVTPVKGSSLQDGLHPSPLGHQQIFKRVRAQLLESPLLGPTR